MINNFTILRIWKKSFLNRPIQANKLNPVNSNWPNLVRVLLFLHQIIKGDKNPKIEIGSDYLKAQLWDKRKIDPYPNLPVDQKYLFLKLLLLSLEKTHKLFLKNLSLQRTWLKFKVNIFSKILNKIDCLFKFIIFIRKIEIVKLNYLTQNIKKY